MRTCKMEVGGHRKIGRPKLRWSDVIRKDTRKKHWIEEFGECQGKLDPNNMEKEKDVSISCIVSFLVAPFPF